MRQRTFALVPRSVAKVFWFFSFNKEHPYFLCGESEPGAKPLALSP
jgi:hypothetical protein